MLWPADILKLGIPAAVGFLLGLGAIAVIGPRSTDGKVLLLGTTMCVTVIVVAGVRAIRSRRTAEPAKGTEEPKDGKGSDSQH